MKFENPIMNISIFDVEDLITTSNPGGGDTPITPQSKTAVMKAQTALENAGQILSFSFNN